MKNQFIKSEASLTRGIPRTQKSVSYYHKTSFNSGLAVPIQCMRVYPGTTIQMDLHTITRMATPVNPIMDDIYQDFYFFFVPMRVILEQSSLKNFNLDWDEFITYADWDDVKNLKLPIMDPGTEFTVAPGSLGHYIGLPLGDYRTEDEIPISLMQLGGYELIWNTYFRDQNYQNEIYTESDHGLGFIGEYDGTIPTYYGGYHEEEDIFYITYGAEPLPVNEFHDPFTSILPQPQKGPESTISLGDMAPVITGENHLSVGSIETPLKFQFTNGSGLSTSVFYNLGAYNGEMRTVPQSDTPGAMGSVVPANLYADLTKATSITINQLRESIVLQHYLETLARSGSRYSEWLLGFFGVVSPDARLQRPELIVGKRVHINISEVLQTSGEAVNDTVLGTTGAVSRTLNSSKGLFTYSATEHGFLYCITCVRHNLSYSQGLSRAFTDIEPLDFYNPVFNGIGEQPVFTREVLMNTGNSSGVKRRDYDNAGSGIVNFGKDASVLGYNEPYWDIFYQPARASGLLDPVGATSLNTWTLTKAFEQSHLKANDVIMSDDATIDRVIRTPSEHQFIGEYLFDMKITARKPLRSTPGLDRI